MIITPNMALIAWNQGSDPYDRDQLAANVNKIDEHDHSAGKGVQIPTGGIEDGAITGQKLAPGALGGTVIEDGSITTPKLADSAVTTDKLDDGSVTGAKFLPGAAGQLLIGDAVGLPTYRTLTGDISVDAAGLSAIGAKKVLAPMIGVWPVARVRHSADQNVVSMSSTVLHFDTESFDSFSTPLHDLSANTRLTAPVTGVYAFYASVVWELSTNGNERRLRIRKNGATYVAEDRTNNTGGGSVNLGNIVSGLTFLAASDYIEVEAFNDSSSGQLVKAFSDYSPTFAMHYYCPTS